MKRPLRKNLVNIIIAAAALSAVLGCFYSQGRNVEVEDPEAAGSNISNTTSPPEAHVREDNGDFVVAHLPVNTPRYLEIARQIKESRMLETAAERLNEALILPADIELRTKDCKEANAFYDPNDRSVTMCFELMEHFYRTFKGAGTPEGKVYDKMNDAVTFVFLHEIGHALIDQYKLPVAGNEEDAADRCAAFISLIELQDEGVRAVYAAADAFAIESKQSENASRSLADEHLLREQRAYNSLCMIYGSDPDKHSKIVDEGYLPKERAIRCKGEFRRTAESWARLLEPWRK
jgi:hypothetical protein